MQQQLLWQLIITLRDRFGCRDVSLEFASRQALEAQVAHIDLRNRTAGSLCSIKNEAGEQLAFRVDRYARYRIREKSPPI